MKPEKINRYIENLEKCNRLDIGTLDYFFAKLILIIRGKNREAFNELIKALNHKDQGILSEVIDILGKIGNKEAVPYLKDMLNRNELWGVTVYSLGIALIRLGDKSGVTFLKEKITNPRVHRHTRIDAARALIRLKMKHVFGKNEKIDFGGETMTAEWSSVLQKLVEKLTA